MTALLLPITPARRTDATLVVAVRDGVADLADVHALRNVSHALARELCREPDEEAWRRALSAQGADEAAATGAARALASALEDPARAPDALGADAFELEAADLFVLARGVLAAGHTLRFRAAGRSMRPFVPHASLLEVVPRPVDALRRGMVALVRTADERLVAHRVLGRTARGLRVRGDSAGRVDLVPDADVLGLVQRVRSPGRESWRAVSRGWRRPAGLVAGATYLLAAACARVLVVKPLRRTFPGRSLLRRTLRLPLWILSSGLVRMERCARRVRAPLDRARAGLLSSEEKDTQRRALYARRGVQHFTALDENLAAGLTTLEETLFARHDLPRGKALVIGCGPGRESFVLAQRGWQVVGLDREAGMLARASREAERRGLPVRFEEGEADAFSIAGGPFDLVVVFSGLYDMLLPERRRVALLARGREHLRPGGALALTFLARYRAPGSPPPSKAKTLLEVVNPEHQDGDLYLLNEAVHVFPRAEDVADEARAAGLAVETLHVEQRAYDRLEGRVRGYAILRRPDE